MPRIGLRAALFHATTGYSFAEAVRSAFADDSLPIEVDGTRSEDTDTYLMDGQRARQILEWTPQYTVEDAFLDMSAH